MEVGVADCARCRQSLCFASLVSIRQTKVVWIAAKLLVAAVCDQEVVFQTQSPAARPVDSRLDRQHHPLSDRARPCLMRKRWFVRPCTDTMADGMRGLTRITALRDPRAHQAIQRRKTCPVTRKPDCFVKHAQ